MLAQYGEFLSSEYNANNASEYSGLINILQTMKKTSWAAENNISDDLPFFTILLDFREETKVVELQLISAQSAYERLTSLSSPDSAAVALEKVRNLLYDISRDSSGPVFDKVEETHELLNTVEVSLNKCARSIDGNSDSLVSILENMVCTGISIEEVDSIIADWNSLARKHGIPPSSLPNCHKSLREELDGNVEALNLLPEAEKDERIALEHFSNACKELSDARIAVAASLSESVSNILPVLGLEETTFQVKMRLRQGGFDRPYHGTESLGVDIADFLLLHRKQSNTAGRDFTMMQNNQLEIQHGGEIEQVGSSGEKSRVLLAIETSLPGSIGSTCNAFSNSADNEQTDDSLKAPPISIIYDEIDAHVGGRAAVTMAKLLANQSRRRPNSLGGNQIIAITHSASIAAIADRHIVVERSKRRDFNSSYQLQPIKSYVVDGSSRRKEIARMASGDLAPGEAEIFADALIRDGLIHKESPLFSELNSRNDFIPPSHQM